MSLKFIVNLLLTSAIIATIYISDVGPGLSFTHIYIVAPLLLSVSLLAIKANPSRLALIVSTAGLLSGIVALFAYYSASTYSGTDGQAALIYAVMPVYQFAFMLVVYSLTLLISKLKASFY